MTTQGLRIGNSTWLNLVDELSLEIGEVYTIQNVSANKILLAEKATIPIGNQPKHYIIPYGSEIIVPEDNIGIWVLAPNITDDNTVDIAVTRNKTVVRKETNGGLPVNIQDQTSRSIILDFNEVSNSTTLSAPAIKGAYTITVTNTTGFTDGKLIILFHPPSENFSFYHQIGAVVGNVVTLDTPIDFAYPAGTFADTAITNMNVDGSITPRIFGLRGTGAPPGVDITVDITRLIFHCVADSAVSLNLFANIAPLTKGLVLRKRNSVVENIFNTKVNHDIAGLMYDFTVEQALNPAQGVDGFISRLTFAGQNKIGVAIRLPVGEDLEFIVQDDLTDITSFEVTAEGHIVTN